MEQQKKYSLYVGAVQETPHGITYSYCGGKLTRMLVYSTRKPKGAFAKLPAELYTKLTADEKAWLAQCQTAINAEYISANAEKIKVTLDELLDNLERELKRETENAAKE